MLNDTRIRQAKAKNRDYKLADYEGLYLLIRTTGAKLWRLNYRFSGKQKSLALGVYSTVTLAEARERRDAARKLLSNGTDPSVKRRLEKIATAAGGNSFHEVAEEFLSKRGREGLAAITTASCTIRHARRGFRRWVRTSPNASWRSPRPTRPPRQPIGPLP